MTQNIEQRTLAATATMEGAAKAVDEIAHKDADVITPVGTRKSFPKISREWDDESQRLQKNWGDESLRLQTEWQNNSSTLRQDWQNERNELSTKALGVKPWESGVSETNINQQRRWDDGHTYLPKTVPAVMDAGGPGDNWIPYTADKSDTLSDVFGRKPVELLTGVILTPDTNLNYPKLSAFGKIWELIDGNQELTVKSFSEVSGVYLVVTLNDDSQVIATKLAGASRDYVQNETHYSNQASTLTNQLKGRRNEIIGQELNGRTAIYIVGDDRNSDRLCVIGTPPTSPISDINLDTMTIMFSNGETRSLSSATTQKIDSVSDFPSISPRLNTFVETRAYYPGWAVLMSSPKGGGLYLIKEATTPVRQYGDHICENGYIAQLVVNGELNAEKYGLIAGYSGLVSRLNSIFQHHSTVYSPAGEYEFDTEAEGQVVFSNGLTLRGDNSQAYGEFYQANPTTYRFINGLSFTMAFPSGSRPLKLRDFNFEGNWLNDGLEHQASTREIDWQNVSFKKFRDGLKTDDGYVVNWNTVTFTCRRTAISWGGGTTLNWNNVGIQGDKESLTRVQIGMEFRDGSAPVLSNSTISGFCQYALTAVKITGSQQLKFDSFDFEDILHNIFDLGDGFRINLTVDNCYLGINDGGGILRISGKVGDASRIKIGTITGRDKHFGNNAVLDWTTEKFIYLYGSGEIGGEASIIIDENVYVRVVDGIDSSIGSSIFLAATNDTLYADYIVIEGSKSIPITWLNRLYRGTALLDDGTYSRVGNAGASFSNGMTYTVGSQIMTAGSDQNQPIRALLAVRSSGTTYVNKIDTVVGANSGEAIDVTFDQASGMLHFTAGLQSQRFVITPN
nr:hypothetical protein [uncultured Vibrio sp.]